MSLSSLKRFGNVVLDLNRVAMVKDGVVFMDDGKMYGIDGKSADAILEFFTPASELQRSEPSQGTCDTAQATNPVSSGPARRSPSRSSAVRARLQCPSSSVTSFPGHEAPAGEDDAEPAEAEDESGEEEQEQQEEEAPRTWTKVTDEEVDEWVARYAEGEKITDIAQDAGRAYATVYRRIHEKLAEQEEEA